MDADERSTWVILSCVALGAYLLKALFIWSRIAKGHRMLHAPMGSLPMLRKLLLQVYVDQEEKNMHPLNVGR